MDRNYLYAKLGTRLADKLKVSLAFHKLEHLIGQDILNETTLKKFTHQQ